MKFSLASTLLVLAASTLGLLSCRDQEARMGKGFRLPEGRLESGQTAFTDLQCHRCHSVRGVTLPDPPDKSAVHFPLGGEVRKVKSYGELVTAIIQPQHVVSPGYLATIAREHRDGISSPMPDYNKLMTVQQLTDLVTFLHAHYQQVSPEYDTYPYYGP